MQSKQAGVKHENISQIYPATETQRRPLVLRGTHGQITSSIPTPPPMECASRLTSICQSQCTCRWRSSGSR
ncbi:hypothetical protein PsYK624_030790 [Phanerochaete sordida]|uniref:Uncharacterized protein n=1 Tax=Phanerochaete sordida TaxID=48140 RepID=A0A9P3L989_9APHY|nr:hypothetical protein PsYK624_030790 [Phanerochaete sordida]